MCALRGRQPGRLNVRAVLRHFIPNKGVPPLRCSLFASSGGSGITNSANEIYRLVPEAIFMNETLLNVFDRSRIAAWLDQLGAGSENKVEEETNGK